VSGMIVLYVFGDEYGAFTALARVSFRFMPVSHVVREFTTA
jgi:hypothetical protein